MNKKLKDKIYYAFLTIGFVLFYVVLINFPAHLIINGITKELSYEQMMSGGRYWEEVAGMPAGDDIPLETDLKDLSKATDQMYVTFETDDIVPLGVYQLKSVVKDGKYFLNSRNRTSGRNGRLRARSVTGRVFERYLYNGYYLVKLPGGEYALAYLDDCYYWKYRISGKVQLPIGYIQVESSGSPAMKYLKEQDELLEKYNIDLESNSWNYSLLMYNEKNYEQHHTLYFFICFFGAAVFFVIYVGIVSIIFDGGIHFKKKNKNS